MFVPAVILLQSLRECQCLVTFGAVYAGLAIHVLLFIQYCPTTEHAKEGPRGLDELIVEVSVVTTFTTV